MAKPIRLQYPVDADTLINVCERTARELGLNTAVVEEDEDDGYEFKEGEVVEKRRYRTTDIRFRDSEKMPFFSISGRVKEEPTNTLWFNYYGGLEEKAKLADEKGQEALHKLAKYLNESPWP